MIYEHTLPYALAIGMTRREFMKSKPIQLVSYGLAHKLKKKMRDEELWLQGFYNKCAFETVIAHFSAGLAGKKSKAEYLKEPLSLRKDPYEGLTQEEIDNLEIQKMINAEELWIAHQKIRGMSETITNK